MTTNPPRTVSDLTLPTTLSARLSASTVEWHCRSLEVLALSFSRLSVTRFAMRHTAPAASLTPGIWQLRASSCAAARTAWPSPMSLPKL